MCEIHYPTRTIANPRSLLVIPHLLADCGKAIEALGEHGRLDPFSAIYQVRISPF